MENPPSRLDMDAEIHQAISMAHRINDKLSLDEEDAEHNEEPIFESSSPTPDIARGLAPPPSSSSCFTSAFTRTEIRKAGLLTILLTLSLLCVFSTGVYSCNLGLGKVPDSAIFAFLLSVTIAFVYTLLSRVI